MVASVLTDSELSPTRDPIQSKTRRDARPKPATVASINAKINSGALDYVNVPSDLSDHVLDSAGRLKSEYVDRGTVLARITQPALQYAYFNMEDPVLGGYTKDRIALRRAIAIGFNTQALIRVVYQGQAIPATQPIPPNLPDTTTAGT